MASALITPPAEEPVTLAEAKAHLRVDIADDDMLISGLIVAARQYAETITRRALVTQSWRLALDRFPSPGMNIGSANWYGPQWGISPGPLTMLQQDGKTGYEIVLPFPPLVSVDSVKYIDQNGEQQILAATEYKVDGITEPARLVPAYGKSWPGTRNEINAVLIDFTCGYGSPADVPAGIKRWMLLRIGALYENREELVVAQRVVVSELPFVDGLLDPYRVVTF